MNIPTTRIFAILLCLAAPGVLLAADSLQAIADRTLIRELMDRYGVVHDSGSPEEYADLFTSDGEIAVVAGGPAILSISRYTDRYARQEGQWRIQRREITIEFGNGALGKQLGFGGG